MKLNQQYGTDAMRFCLASMAAPGTDIVLSDDRLGGARNFANKIWNASRFLFVNLDKFEEGGSTIEELASPEVREKRHTRSVAAVPLADEWIFERLASTIATVNAALANYRFHEAAQVIYQFFWGDFCDWYIEWIKPDLLNVDRERAAVSWKNLFAVFDSALRLLHPFMPFITEELWWQLPQAKGDKSIALKSYPEEGSGRPADSGKGVYASAGSNLRSAQYSRGDETGSEEESGCGILQFARRFALGNSEEHRWHPAASDLVGAESFREAVGVRGGAMRSTAQFDIRIAYSDAVDVAAERNGCARKLSDCKRISRRKSGNLGTRTFCSRAPEKIIKGMQSHIRRAAHRTGKAIGARCSNWRAQRSCAIRVGHRCRIIDSLALTE